ncbi:MAG: transposase, partial [Alteromonadales bacterium]|nr:transposase [Alteromonadales bacterium]
KLSLRQIKVTVTQPGFRTKSFHIVTTLTDPSCYSAKAVADLYFQRWEVELYFRDIKTTIKTRNEPPGTGASVITTV